MRATKPAAAVVLSLVILMLATRPANAQEGVIIEGSLDCGEWVNARTKALSSNLQHYLLGLINGLTLGHGHEFWRAGGSKLSREAVYLWMDSYCRQNPLKDVVTGAVALYQERSGWRP